MIKQIQSKYRLLEQEIIARLIIEEKEVKIVANVLSDDEMYFYRKQFEIIKDCYFNGKNVAIEFSQNNLNLTEFLDKYTFRNSLDIAKEIKEISNSQKIFAILDNAVNNIPSSNVFEFISNLQKELFSNVKRFDEDKTSIESVIKEFKEKQEFYKEKFKNGSGIIGIETGFSKLDNVIDGLRPEHLWIIGGYTNMGKTSASLNIVASLINQGKRVVYYSLEMGSVDILQRLIGIMTNQNGLSIIKGFTKDEKSVEDTLEKVKQSKLSIHSFNSDISELVASMFEENLKQPVDLFVLDFIQLVSVKGSKSEYETITNAILELQRTAKRFKTPIMVLSQISNEGAKAGDSPVMSFKGSGSIASAADLAIEIKSGEETNDSLKQKLNNNEPVKMKWDVRKNRHGKVGTIDMVFNGQTGIFRQDIPENDKINGLKFGSFD